MLNDKVIVNISFPVLILVTIVNYSGRAHYSSHLTVNLYFYDNHVLVVIIL